MSWIAGVDGCKNGWVAALRDLGRGDVTWERFDRLEDLLASKYSPALVAIDIPIGLAEAGYRVCDVQARRLLAGRASSVFPAPIRPLLETADYATANALSREISGNGLSRQSYGILAKVREADSIVRGAKPGLLREAHPELAFIALKGNALAQSKHHPLGLRERRALLADVHGEALVELELRRKGTGVGIADLYDALAVLETAERLIRGAACRVPERPPLDAFGLPMEITFFRYDG